MLTEIPNRALHPAHEPECRAGFPACRFTGLSSPVDQRLATRKSPEPAGWKACATSQSHFSGAMRAPSSEDALPEAEHRQQRGHQHGAQTQHRVALHGFAGGCAFLGQILETTQHHHAMSTAWPNSAMKPMAADTLNGMPVSKSAKIPPISANGTFIRMSSASLTDLKASNNSRKIRNTLAGTMM